jgi:phosphatidylserine/phosphatidylglycerophosphate/cardiolipin synthase-like enzyme
MDALEQAFLQSFTAGILTRQDKQYLKKLIADINPDERTRAWLRSRIFDWALTHVKDIQSQQVLAWLEEANKILASVAQPAVPDQVYFSPGTDCLQAITRHLQNAIRTVDICVFTISDNRISGQIIACHQSGKQVRIITDNEKLYDTGSDIQQLADAGIAVRVDRTSNHMHHKFALVDGQTVLTGSYNWTRSAAEYNQENILITGNKQVVSVFEKEFAKLWRELDAY